MKTQKYKFYFLLAISFSMIESAKAQTCKQIFRNGIYENKEFPREITFSVTNTSIESPDSPINVNKNIFGRYSREESHLAQLPAVVASAMKFINQTSDVSVPSTVKIGDRTIEVKYEDLVDSVDLRGLDLGLVEKFLIANQLDLTEYNKLSVIAASPLWSKSRIGENPRNIPVEVFQLIGRQTDPKNMAVAGKILSEFTKNQGATWLYAYAPELLDYVLSQPAWANHIDGVRLVEHLLLLPKLYQWKQPRAQSYKIRTKFYTNIILNPAWAARSRYLTWLEYQLKNGELSILNFAGATENMPSQKAARLIEKYIFSRSDKTSWLYVLIQQVPMEINLSTDVFGKYLINGKESISDLRFILQETQWGNTSFAVPWIKMALNSQPTLVSSAREEWYWTPDVIRDLTPLKENPNWIYAAEVENLLREKSISLEKNTMRIRKIKAWLNSLISRVL